MTLRIILLIIVAGIWFYGLFCYVGEIIEEKHKEMMNTYIHRCNGGMTDEEIKEIQREDE